jgi:hypothetical protein
MRTGFRMAFGVMFGFGDCLMRLRTLGIVGRGNVVLPCPFPALFHRETAAMLPTFFRALAAAGVILAGERNSRIVTLEGW